MDDAPKDVSRSDGWISVKDRLPESSTIERQNIVLIWFRGTALGTNEAFYVQLGEHCLGHWRPIGGNGNFDDRVSHWMPLPPRPAEKPD